MLLLARVAQQARLADRFDERLIQCHRRPRQWREPASGSRQPEEQADLGQRQRYGHGHPEGLVDVVPQRFVAESLLEMLRSRDDLSGRTILYVTGQGSREVLPQGLGEIGADVEVIEAYRSIPDGQGAERLARTIEAGKLDLATFTSGSAVRGYVDAIGEDLAKRVPAASIGPQTSDALRDAGIEVRAEAKESTLDGLVSAVLSVV